MAFFPPFRRYQAKDQDVNRIQDFVATLAQRLLDFTTTSMIRLSTGNGHGTSATKIRRFSLVTEQVGPAIDYVDSATMGASFTVRESGVYSISYIDTHAGAAFNIGLSCNSTELQTSIISIVAGDRLGSVNVAATERPCLSVVVRLNAGDVIRPHTDAVPTSTAATIQFIMTQIGKF